MKKNSSFALRSVVQEEIDRQESERVSASKGERKKERKRERRFELASIFLYQCGNRNEGMSSIILTI